MNMSRKAVFIALSVAITISAFSAGCTAKTDPVVEKKIVTVESEASDPEVVVTRDRDVSTTQQTSVTTQSPPPTTTEATTTTETRVELEGTKAEDPVEVDSSADQGSYRDPVTSSDSAMEIAFTTNEETVSREIQNQAVRINAKGGDYTLKGDVTDLVISGNDNTVVVASADSISINGDKNRVKWSGTQPIITDNGTGNLIEATL